jgi:hypothetical protein
MKFEKFCEIKAIDDSLMTETQHIGNELLKTLFPDDNIDNDSQIHKNIRSNAQKAYEDTDDLLFSANEITFVINGQNSKKAPGIDGITADIV